MDRKIMPTTWFLSVLILIVLISFLLGERKIIPYPYNQVGWLAVILGIVLNLWTDNLFKKYGTTVKPYLKPDHFIVKGPFRISRNPMYLGMFFILTGAVILLKSVFLLFLPFSFAIIINDLYVRKEELYMTEQFGEEFLEYKHKVRRWL